MNPSSPSPDAAGAKEKSRGPIDWAAVRARVERATASHDRPEDLAAAEKAVLARRARALAVPAAPEVPPGQTLPVMAFELSGQVFGLDAAHVREAMLPRDLTPLPGVPAFVRGLVNRRSRIVPAFDLKPLLRLPGRGAATDEKLLIFAWEGTEFGVVVDQVLGLRTIATARLRTEVSGLDATYLRGMADDGLILLDLSLLLPDLVVDEAGDSSLQFPSVS